MNTAPLPDFARRETIRGLQKLVMLRLQGAPPEEGIELVAAVWLEALASLKIGWEEQHDQGRIQAAFSRLIADAERWPPPKMLIERIPPRPPPKALPHYRYTTPEEEALGHENLKQLYQIIKQSLVKGLDDGEKTENPSRSDGGAEQG